MQISCVVCSRPSVPRWAELPLERVPSAGTDNAIYRLGDELAVRLPRIHWAVDNVAKEQKWLPVLAPHLPLQVPVPVAVGEPEEAFPYPWGVVQWLPDSSRPLTGSMIPSKPRSISPRSCGRSNRWTPPADRSTIVVSRFVSPTRWCARASPVSEARSTAMPSSKSGTGS